MSKKLDKQQTSPKEKEIDSIKLIYLVVFLVVAGMVILYAGNVFDTIPAVSNSGFNNPAPDAGMGENNPHAGADLNQLQRIKDLEDEYSKTKSAQTLLDLGHLYNDSGFLDKAIETYKKYLKDNPKNADVIVDLGVCYFNKNEYEQAEKVMKGAIAINPRHQIGKFNLGIVTFSKGDVTAAKKWWQECIDLNPNTEIAQKAKSLLESH